MNAIEAATEPVNILPLPVQPRQPSKRSKERFKVLEFTNPRTHTKSWRVSGIKRDRSRIRENFAEEATAKCRQIALETEYLQGHVETAIQATKLSADQIRLCEATVVQLGDDWPRILDAAVYWQQHGKQRMTVESRRIDDAVDKYLEWLAASPFRATTKRHWKTRMTVFKNSVPNVRVAEVTPDFIEDFLKKRNVSPAGKDTDRRAVSRFFSWCIERPRRWAVSNPCREVKVEQGESGPVKILSLDECKALLKAAKPAGLAPYVAVCLFGGLRPFEASRLTWDAINLDDNEIRLEGTQTKTGKPRVVSICDTLAAWLNEYEGKALFPPNWRKRFDGVKRAAGFGSQWKNHKAFKRWPHGKAKPRCFCEACCKKDKITLKPWIDDVLRHTAISHYFRKTGSYGQTAEQFGNSEAIIKNHYQGRVSSEDTKKFYALLPKSK
jgi:integrase